MSVLTENVVLARAKAQDLNSVRKLNCWGSDLTDVSIVRKMAFVEVLSLSVNNISTLADFSYCPNLQELYLRKNNILNLSEVCYLKSLPHLCSLWLADNPCAEHNNYRLTVLRALPNLKRLDNIIVHPDEVVKAAASGDDLEIPFKLDSVNIERNSHSSFTHDAEVSTVAHHISKLNDFGIADEQIDLHSTSIQSLLPERLPPEAIAKPHVVTFKTCPMSSVNDIVTEFRAPHVSVNKSTLSDHQHAFQARVQTLFDHPLCRDSHLNNEMMNETLLDDQFPEKNIALENSNSQVTDDPDDTASNGDGYLQSLKRNDEFYTSRDNFDENFDKLKAGQVQMNDKSSPNRSFRKIMNSNILSAVLCLVKELDFASLQVVKTAIHCRMDEMSD